jgi:hypothetical protein
MYVHYFGMDLCCSYTMHVRRHDAYVCMYVLTMSTHACVHIRAESMLVCRHIKVSQKLLMSVSNVFMYV